jgi:hypothetical protein
MTHSKKKTVRRTAEPGLGDIRLDPLLVGADREFLDTFPRAVVQETGALPVRRYGGFGLVVTRGSGDALKRLQRESDMRLVGVPALNSFGVDLFLRYWTGGDDANTPALWVSDARRNYLRKLGGMISLRGQVNSVGVLMSLVTSSPLLGRCPLVVMRVGDEGQVLFLHGMGGLRVGVRFPGGWQKEVMERLRAEFNLQGVTSADGHLIENRGPEERGLHDLTATVLPPLEGETLILEPRGRARAT